MQYKSTRKGYNNRKIKKEHMHRLKNLKRGAIIIGGIVITFCSFSSFKDKVSNAKEGTSIEDIVKYEGCDINPLYFAKAGFNTDVLLNGYQKVVDNEVINNDEYTEDNEEMHKNDIKELFIKYCNIYNVDANVVYEKASFLTNNFTSEDYITNNRIVGTTVCGKERVFDNIESGIICFIRHIKQLPQDFDLIPDSIQLDSDYTLDRKCENQVKEYCDIFGGIEKELCMSIIYSENARDLSGKQITENYNPGCLRNSEGKMACFENVEQGIIEMLLNLKYRYLEDMNLQNYNINELIDKIQLSYAPINDPDNEILKVNENWSRNVKNIYLELKDDYYSVCNERNGLNR